MTRDGVIVIRIERVEGDRATISAVDYPLAPWWSVPQGRLLGVWRECGFDDAPHPERPILFDGKTEGIDPATFERRFGHIPLETER